MNKIVEIEDLSVGYGSGRSKVVLLRNVNVKLHRGGVTCMFGANGSGKSTLLRTIAGEQLPLSGRIKIEGEDMTKLSIRRRAQMISVVYTDHSCPDRLKVNEVVAIGRQPHTGMLGRLSAEDHRIVSQSLEAVGLETMSGKYMTEISDGERQKVMIARALAQQTPVMLLDEPTSYLDVASRIEVMEMLGRLAKEYNRAVLLTTHDVAEALSVAEMAWLIPGDGRLIDGVVSELIASGKMDTLFEARGLKFDARVMDYRKDL